MFEDIQNLFTFAFTFDQLVVNLTVAMVIGDNLAQAFGLVGAMSIIRFRTAI